MVFGVFDGLHEGHRHFLNEAKKRCDELVVVVSQDEAARALKGREPHKPFEERVIDIRAFDTSFIVVAGDTIHGSWEVLAKQEPDIVFAGYDQRELAEALEEKGIRVEFISPHHPHEFKSSILRQKPDTNAVS
jgi:cytidyltransferase-like protein